MDTRYRVPPEGFTKKTWQQFDEQGILVFENAMPRDLVQEYLQCLEVIWLQADQQQKEKGLVLLNIVELHPIFAGLIDHPAHIGFAYDLYGEALKLLYSAIFIRPPHQEAINDWHFDGPRLLPFDVFSERLPLRIKVGYWLTDVSQDKHGNFVYIPGSHRQPYLEQYKTHDPHPNEVTMKAAPGTMFIMYAGLWHRVQENDSEQTRMNFFLEYGPAWIHTGDRTHADAAWMNSLDREKRIIMRNYNHPNLCIKPPLEDSCFWIEKAKMTENVSIKNMCR